MYVPESAADPFMPPASGMGLKRIPAADALRWNKHHLAQYAPIPARAAWNCAAYAARWKPRQVAGQSAPRVIRRAHGLCVRALAGFNFGSPPTLPSIWMLIPVLDQFLWIVRSQYKARWGENKSEAKFAAAECQWKWKPDRGILKFSKSEWSVASGQ